MKTFQDASSLLNVQGGFLRSLENNVAMIRALGFETQIKLFNQTSPPPRLPLVILVENVRGEQVKISCSTGEVHHVIRSKTSILFEVRDSTVQKIVLRSPQQSEEFDFILFGDVHGVFANLQEIIQTANTLKPQFIMANGDMTHNGQLSDYHTLIDMINKSEVPFFTSIGNHDKRVRGSRATYRHMLAPFYYSFSVGAVRCIVLDSSRKRGLPKFQYRWLERELQLAQHKRIFVFLHRPPVCPKYNYLSFSASANARRFMSLMEQYQVEMVFGSHIHVLTEFYKHNVRYLVTGGGGGALWQPSNIHHYLRVCVKDDGVEIQVLELPTPEAKISQRVKDAIKFNLEFHLNKTRRLRELAVLHATLLLSRRQNARKRVSRRRKN